MIIRICRIEGCNNKHHAKGLCLKHYRKQHHQDNREKILKRYKRWREKNSEWIKRWWKENSKKIKTYRERHKEKQEKYYYWWYHTKGRKRAKNYCEIIMLWQKANPEKVKARIMLREAIRKGILCRPKKCSLCRKLRRVNGHHQDYSKALEVVWACGSCHKKLHNQVKSPVS